MTRISGAAWKTGLTAGLVLAAVAGTILVLRLLPLFLEPFLAGKLRGEGLEVKALSLETVGLTGSVAGKGAVRRGPLFLDWESLEVRYRPAGLVAGQLDSLLVRGPGLTVALPPGGGSFPVVESSPAPPPEPETAEGGKEDFPPPATAPGGDVGVALSADEGPAPLPDFHRLLQELPVRDRIAFEGGRLGLDFPGGESRFFHWNGSVQKAPESVEGAFHLEGDALSLEASLRSSRGASSLNVISTFEAQPERILETFLDWRQMRPPEGHSLELGTEAVLHGESLLEVRKDGDLRLSLEAELERFRFRGGPFGNAVTLERLLLVGTGSREGIRIQAGADLGSFSQDGVSLNPFSLQFDLDPEGDMSFESGEIGFRVAAASGTFALRGGGAVSSLALGIPPRTEFSFTECVFPAFRIEPFSLLLEGESRTIELRASPIGLKDEETLWIEDLEAAYRRDSGTAEAGFTWFSGSGARMGTVRVETEAAQAGGWLAKVQLDDGDDGGLFGGTVKRSGHSGRVEADGRLPLTWLNALNRWGDVLPARLSGRDPVLETRMTFAPASLKGRLRFGIEGLDAAFDNGTSLEGIRGEGRFQVNLLPRTDGWQTLQVEKIDTGGIVLEGLAMEWSLPSINRLQFREVGAAIGGGRMSVDPFSLNPLDPGFETRLTFAEIRGDALLEWIGEDRFAIVGSVSGSIRLRWNEGVLQLGSGELSMDPAEAGNRFVFSDEAFLVEQFSAMGGVPEEIRSRFLTALLQEGILIENLQVRLLPLPEEEEVTLRVILKGRTRTDELDVPIEELIINNVIPEADLGRLLGLMGPIDVVEFP